MAKSSSWTDAELVLLKEHFPHCGRDPKLLSIFPGRTLDAIALKANRIGLKVLANSKKARTHEEYLILLESTEFITLEEYKGSTNPILHMCGVCDLEWLARPQHILKPGAKCPNCSLKSRLVSEQEVDRVLSESNITRNSKYTGSLDNISLTHKTCGYTWLGKYSYVQQGSGCPSCNKSFGYSEGKYPDKAKLYLLSITTEDAQFLKLGVTVQPLKRRISELMSNIQNCKSISCIHFVESTGIAIIQKESQILKDPYLTKYTHVHKFAGHTELLSTDNDTAYIINKMNENI